MRHYEADPTDDCPGQLRYRTSWVDRLPRPPKVLELCTAAYTCHDCLQDVYVRHKLLDPPDGQLVSLYELKPYDGE